MTLMLFSSGSNAAVKPCSALHVILPVLLIDAGISLHLSPDWLKASRQSAGCNNVAGCKSQAC